MSSNVAVPTLLFVASACACTASGARADDPRLPWSAPAQSTAHSWTGLYVGAQAGLAVLDEGRTAPAAGLTLPGGRLAVGALPTLPSLPVATAPAPFTGPQSERVRASFGVQAGYNHQLDPGSGVVVGIETDVTGLSALPKR